MVRLEHSKALGRIIRKDDIKEADIPTWELVRKAVKAGKVDEALRLIDYGCWEDKTMHDGMVSFVDSALGDVISIDEKRVNEIIRNRYYPAISRYLSHNPSVEDSLQWGLEYQRGHGGKATLTEEADRYVVRIDPCGSGGQLRRARETATIKGAYPWTWGKKNVPPYCAHCPIMWEILPTEIRGYPIKIIVMGDKPSDPCFQYYYKKPELIPEKYFTEIGMTKKIK